MSNISKAQQIVNNVISNYLIKHKKTLNFTNISIIYKPYSLHECINIPFDYDGLLYTKELSYDIHENLIDLLDLFLETAVKIRDNDLQKSVKYGSVSYKNLYIMWDLSHDMINKNQKEQGIIYNAASKYYAKLYAY